MVRGCTGAISFIDTAGVSQRRPTLALAPIAMEQIFGMVKFLMEIQYFLFNISPNSSWAEWGSQFLLKTAFVPSWFAGSSWFRLGFRCLSPFFSLLSFLRKGFLFWFAGSSSFWRWFRCLSPFFSFLSFLRKRVLFHHGFPGSSCFGLGFRCLSPFFSLFAGAIVLKRKQLVPVLDSSEN